MPRSVHLVSLGCPKNRVDSEIMLGHLSQKGFTVAEQAHDADVIVVNTCAFIDSAKEESVDAILEMAEAKNDRPETKLVVAGCLSQRYAPDLAKEIPEVDHFLGTGNFETIAEVVTNSEAALPILDQSPPAAQRNHPRLTGSNRLVPYHHDSESGVAIPDPDFTITSSSPRVATLPAYTAYLKISEGCSNTCAFCIIPKLRGPQRSRPIRDIVAEAETLLERGAVEINLIAQDLCGFGKDLHPRSNLAQLLKVLDKTASAAGRPVWIRCLYAYPRGLTREVIRVLGSSAHVAPYLDLPLQHIADPILRRMRRGKGGTSTKELLRRLRRELPGFALRTTFITGLPGESDADFAELLDFVEEIRFDHLGVFTYSPEEHTPAASMADPVPNEIATQRRDQLLRRQKNITREQNESRVGTTLDVLVEGVSSETDLLLQGRHAQQAPEIDGVAYITEGQAEPGDLVKIRVEQAHDYDVAGPMVPT